MSNTKEGPLYKRVLLKLSGEALMGDTDFGIDPTVLDRIAKEIDAVVRQGIEIGIVLGGGNLFRGKALSSAGLGRVTGDHMGMLATVMNGLALRDALERIDLPSRIMSAIPLSGVVDSYNRRKAITHIRDKKVIIFTAGTGNPFFTTDTAACLRAIEIEADVVLKATKVDGVYTADPSVDSTSKLLPQVTYDEVLAKKLNVMDMTAISLCREHELPLRIFNMTKPNSLVDVMNIREMGSVISS